MMMTTLFLPSWSPQSQSCPLVTSALGKIPFASIVFAPSRGGTRDLKNGRPGSQKRTTKQSVVQSKGSRTKVNRFDNQPSSSFFQPGSPFYQPITPFNPLSSFSQPSTSFNRPTTPFNWPSSIGQQSSSFNQTSYYTIQ